MTQITWDDFQKVDIKVGKIVEVKDYPEARIPAYILYVDLGDEGIKKSSAQITVNYNKDELLNKMVVCVTNFPPKQIGKIISEVLVTGFPDENGNVVLCTPDKNVPVGAALY